MGKNDEAWELLFEKYDVLERVKNDGKFTISANSIKEFREPRLMTKFDHTINLPKIFKDNSLSILPITRGDYVISSFFAYKEFEPVRADASRVSVPSHLQSLSSEFLVNESIALNCANSCGILSDFLEDENIVPTVNGRMGSGSFDFKIATKESEACLNVNNSQIEIDAAYEGVNYFSIIEAKRDLSEDFLVRQLYYPFRTWQKRLTKPIKTVFLVFSNGVFYLYQYQFENIDRYNSLRLIKQKNYTLSQEIVLADIESIIRDTPVAAEPEVAFPQANSMLKLINLIELLSEKPLSRQDITRRYAFDERQTNYYTDAGRYLGLIYKERKEEKIVFHLTKLGLQVVGQEYRERQLSIVRQILKHKVFKEALKIHLQCGEMPNLQVIVKIMKASGLHNVESDSTYERRASTVMRWLEWILGLVEE